MGHQYLSHSGSRIFPFQKAFYGFRTGERLLILKNISHITRFQKRQKPEFHFPVFIGKRHFFQMLRRRGRYHPGYVKPLPLQQSAGKVKPLRRIVISADDQDIHIQVCQFPDKFIKNSHCLRRGDAFVINVPCDDNGLWL